MIKKRSFSVEKICGQTSILGQYQTSNKGGMGGVFCTKCKFDYCKLDIDQKLRFACRFHLDISFIHFKKSIWPVDLNTGAK